MKRWNDVARQFLGDDFFSGFTNGAEEKNGPSADVYHNEHEVIVLVDLPGVENIQGLEMSVQDEKLRLKGSFASPYQGYELKSSERKKGEFEKVISLGTHVSSKYTSAQYRKGVLELRFPRIGKGTTQKIKLKRNL